MVNNVSGKISGINNKLNPDSPQSLADLKKQVGSLSNESKHDLIMKADAFKVKVANEFDHPSLDDESIEKFIHDKESIVAPVKIKADVFINKVSHCNDNVIAADDNMDFKNKKVKTSVNNTNAFNFTVIKGELEKEAPVQVKKEKVEKTTEVNNRTKDSGPADYVTAGIDKAKGNITELISKNKTKNTEYSSHVFNVESMLLLADALAKLEKIKLMSPANLKKMDEIIGRIIEGRADKLSNADLKQLKEFCNIVSENAKGLDIDKSSFQALSNLIDGVMVAREAVKGKREEFLKKAEVTEKKLEKLVTIVSDPSLKIDLNFVEMLSTVKAKYASIKASGDPVAIAIYSKYLDKLMQALEDIKSGKQKDPLIFRKIQTEYENFSKNLFQKLGTNQVPVEEIKSFLGEDSGPIITMLQTEIDQVKKAPPGKAGLKPSLTDPSNSDNSAHDNNTFENRKKLLSFTPEESSKVSKVNLNGVRKAMENESISSAISELRTAIADTNKSFQELVDAQVNLIKIETAMVNLLISQSFKRAIEYLKSGPELVNNKLTQLIDQLIANADRLQAEMDLSVDPSAASMAELLKIFREIIVELDIELKRISKKEEDQDSLDEKFSKAIQDNKERQDKLDREKIEIMKADEIHKSKKINQFSFDLGLD